MRLSFSRASNASGSPLWHEKALWADKDDKAKRRLEMKKGAPIKLEQPPMKKTSQTQRARMPKVSRPAASRGPKAAARVDRDESAP